MPESSEPEAVDTDPQSTPIEAEPDTDAEPPTEPSEPIPVPAEPVAVPGQYHYLKRWTFVLVVAAVWIPAEAIGIGLYYWWFHALDKTWPVFVVLVFVVVCATAGLLSAMTDKALVSALAIALMSAPFAATLAAAVLHGLYYCDRVGPCLVGVIPY